MAQEQINVDAVVVGAGFAGLYLLYRMRKAGMTAIAFEQGTNVGGTWYWNRYPGARCDAESLAYSFSFSEALEQSWQWSERYATQPEIERYAQHVADRFDLRKDIRFNQTVNAAVFDETDQIWTVTTETGLQATGKYCIMATGCLSVPQVPDIPGLADFAGDRYQASQWPLDGFDFSSQKVGLIGTGSSGIQSVPVIAEQAEHLFVFQRTPNFSVPAVNYPLEEDWVSQFKQHYQDHRRYHKLGLSSGFGDLEIEPRERTPVRTTAADLSEAEVAEILDPYWSRGGAFFLSAFEDALSNPATNAKVAEYVRNKIRQIVKDTDTAEALCPIDHPIGTKRICVDTDYYATYNRPNVTLINLRQDPIVSVTATGIQTTQQHYDLDALVLATGFDAMTGALGRIDIRGKGGEVLSEAWAAGPRTYLGLQVCGFPNLFTVTGPGSPSVLSNMLVSIEQHVDFIMDLLTYMRENQHDLVEAQDDAQDQWVSHVNEVANATLFPQGGSWYLGANVPDKPRVFMPYAAGVGAYREICDQVADAQYRGFAFS